MPSSPEFWSAVAAIGALFSTIIAAWQSMRYSALAVRMQRAEHIRENKSLWHGLDIMVLSSDQKVRKLVAKHQFGIDDDDQIIRIYILFAFLNIAHSLHHYVKQGTIDIESASPLHQRQDWQSL